MPDFEDIQVKKSRNENLGFFFFNLYGIWMFLSPTKLGIFVLEILEGWLLYWPDVDFFSPWDFVPPAQGSEGEFPLSHSMPWACLWTMVCLGERTEDLCSLLPDGSQRPLKFLLKILAVLNINICRFR